MGKKASNPPPPRPQPQPIRKGREIRFKRQPFWKRFFNRYIGFKPYITPIGRPPIGRKRRGNMADEEKAIEGIHPGQEGFVKRITPVKPKEEEGVFLFKCPSCNGIHFRHAGYVRSLVPFIRAGDERRVNADSVAVHICVKCKTAVVWINEQMYDITDQIDLNAWEKTEKEAHKATGPGGEC